MNSPEDIYNEMWKATYDMYFLNQENVTTLYLIRHGQDELPTAENNYDQPLNSKGILNSHRVGKRLADYGITQLFSSPLLRARQTADIIGSHTQLTNQVKDELGEISCSGDFWNYARGLLEITKNCIKNKRPRGDSFQRANWPIVYGLESGQMLRKRSVKAINMVIDKYPGQKIAVVSHYGFINAYISAMLGLRTVELFLAEGTGITTVRAYKKNRLLVNLNDASHVET